MTTLLIFDMTPPDEDAAQRMANEGDATDGPGDALHVVVDLVHQLVCHRLEILHI
jgi:hypothetical protein